MKEKNRRFVLSRNVFPTSRENMEIEREYTYGKLRPV